MLVLEGNSDQINAAAKRELESILKTRLEADECTFDQFIDSPLSGGVTRRLLVVEEEDKQHGRQLQPPVDRYGAAFVAVFTDADAARASKIRLEQDTATVLGDIQTDWKDRQSNNNELPDLPAVDVYLSAVIMQTDAPRGESDDSGLGLGGLIGIVAGCIIAVGVVLVVGTMAKRTRKDRHEQQKTDERSKLPQSIRDTLAGDLAEDIARAQTEGHLSQLNSSHNGGKGSMPGRPEDVPEMVLLRQQRIQEEQNRGSSPSTASVSGGSDRSSGTSVTEWGNVGLVRPEHVNVPLDLSGNETERAVAMLDHTRRLDANHLNPDTPVATVIDVGGDDSARRRTRSFEREA